MILLGHTYLSTMFALCAALAYTDYELVFADGRREPAQDIAKDSKGRWMATREGRRTPLHVGEVAAFVDGEGKETTLIPDIADGGDGPELPAALASLRDLKNKEWDKSADRLGEHPARAALSALVALATDKTKELRARGIEALARMHTRESTIAAAKAVLAEKDVALRRSASSILFSVEEIFRRAETNDLVKAGIADADAGVRVAFAQLSPRDLEAATAVLRNDGLKHADHHVRESAATELARRGDASGESILIGLLGRTKLPGFDGSPESMEKYLVREQVEVCRLLGTFATPTSRAALEKAMSSKFDAVKKAAKTALDSTVKK